jgi:hypothetical protein
MADADSATAEFRDTKPCAELTASAINATSWARG